MTKVQVARLVTIAMVSVPLAACSVASFRQPVEDFALATRDTAEALGGLDQQVTDGYTALIRKRVAAGQLQARIQKDDCGVESQRCRIVAVDKLGNEQPLAPDSAMRKMLILMGSIRRYADGLAEIVNADTAAEVATHVNATVGSLNNLAATVAKLDGTDKATAVNLTDYATPVGNLVSWLAGQYIAKMQLDGLRRATADARPVISGAAEVFTLAAAESSMVPRALMAEEVSASIDALRSNVNVPNIDAVARSAARYDGLLLAKPPSVFVQFQQSHEALVAKIQDEQVTFAEVVARIEAFAAGAKELADLVRKLEAAGEKEGEG